MALVSGVGGGKGTATKTATSSNIYSLLNPTLAAKQNAQKAVSQKAVKNLAPKATTKVLATPKKVTPPVKNGGPVVPIEVLPPVEEIPVIEETPVVADPWTLEGDPIYNAAMTAGYSKFNTARAAALAEKQNAQSSAARETKSLDLNAEENRRRLAGNYAARGMAGGFAGALRVSEARANAEQIAARTDISAQLDALNKQYIANFGVDGTDWTGTSVGQQYEAEARQQAITAQLARYGVA